MKSSECDNLLTRLEQKEDQLSQLSYDDMAVVEEFKLRIVSLAEDQYRLA